MTRRTAAELARHAKELGGDPFPDDLPEERSIVWWYPPDQYELGALHRLVREGFATGRHIDYPRNHGALLDRARFRFASGGGVVRLRASGRIDGRAHVELDTERGERIEVDVRAQSGSPVAVGVEPHSAPTSGWEVRVAGTWRPARPRDGGAVPPHDAEEPVHHLDTVLRDGLHVLPAPALGRPLVRTAAARPSVVSGESAEEARAGWEHWENEQDDLARVDGGLWRAGAQRAARYTAVDAEDAQVSVAATIRPVRRRGAFVSADARLGRIWATATYTHRLCMQRLLLDGIKRDRMPWIGDTALGVLVSAYTFADLPILRDGLVALGRPRAGYVNGIADYSLWWVIAHGLLLRQFGDVAFAEQEADAIDAALQALAGETVDGRFRPVRTADSFVASGPGSVFIDWGVRLEEGRDPTSLQMLWLWALRAGGAVLGAAGHGAAAGWTSRAEAVAQMLRTRAWHEERGWSAYLDGEEPDTGYAGFLSVLAGAVDPGHPALRPALLGAPVGTPFMRTFSLMALGRAGLRAEALDALGREWGALLGSGSFPEDFDAEGDPLAMYGRPFGKSRCHGWSAGPAALLPQLALGVEPLEDGWRTFAVDPLPGCVDTEAVVSLPGGDLVVRVIGGRCTIEVPGGHALIDARGRHEGPVVVER